MVDFMSLAYIVAEKSYLQSWSHENHENFRQILSVPEIYKNCAILTFEVSKYRFSGSRNPNLPRKSSYHHILVTFIAPKYKPLKWN